MIDKCLKTLKVDERGYATVISMKKSLSTAIIIGVLGVAGSVGFATYYFANLYLTSNRTAASESARSHCHGQHATYVVTIAGNVVTPQHTQAVWCDNLTIINADDTLREIAFGKHDKHETYDGVTQESLKKDASFSVVLNQLGTYTFHDHLNHDVAGDFTVTKIE